MQDLQMLRAFVAVAREGSVSRASDRLCLSQPAVSLKLKQLQEMLDLKLFCRRPHGLTLTEDGKSLLLIAEKILATIADFNRSAKALKNTLHGQLRIGTIVDAEFIRLGAFLRHLVERAPEVETELRYGMSGSVLAQLNREELDVGFYLAPPGVGPGDAAPVVAYRELAHFDYHLIAPAGWGNRLARTDWRSLAALPWIITPPESVHYRLLHGVLDPLGLVPNRVADVDQEACMLDLVRAGVGLSLARDALALVEKQERDLEIVEGIRLPCALSFIWHQDRGDDPIITEALDILDSVWTNRPGSLSSVYEDFLDAVTVGDELIASTTASAERTADSSRGTPSLAQEPQKKTFRPGC